MKDLIKNFKSWYGLNYEIAYFFNVYGKNHIKKGKYATVVAIFEELYKKNKSLTVVSPGTQTRDFTHIDDIISGLILICNHEKNKEWFLRSGKNISIIELAGYFGASYEIVPERRGERFTSEYFVSDTENVLNWKPKISLSNYVNDFIETYKR